MELLNITRCCTPALPSAYADALSYYEAICKLQAAVNEVISTLNSYTPVTIEWVKDYVDTIVNPLIVEIRAVESNVDAKLANQNAYIMTELTNTVEFVNTILENYLSQSKAYTDEQIKILNEKINDVSINGVYVYNPLKGYWTSVNVAIQDIYEAARIYGLTCSEYSSLDYTCEEFDNKYYTSLEWDFYAKDLLYSYLKRIISPITGELVTCQEMANQLAGLHQNGITAKNYDALELTAETYDNKQITAYNYDFYGLAA